MTTPKSFFLAILLALFWLSTVQAQARKPSAPSPKLMIPLERDWFFREVGKPTWYPAMVPGCVHTDLLSNKLIDDPFWRDNEKKQQWIGKTDWEYRTTFNVTPQLLKHAKIELVFEGLDTYANVFLNEATLLNADNMFRTWRVDAKPHLRPGLNTLRIHFRSPINEILPIMAKMQYELPAANDQGEKTSPHTRKAPYQYGWDWGPRFVTSGVWRPVHLEAWDEARLDDLHLLPRKITAKTANMTAQLEVVASRDVAAKIIVENLTDKSVVVTEDVTLAPGTNKFDLDFVVPNPTLWWPNGLGKHPLYNFKARLLVGGKLADQSVRRTGLRSLELKQEKDAVGKTFTFVVNGVPIFAKGGNWIPADSFPSRITTAKYRQLLESVRDTNMNMLRVWGGGIYERDDFYELCDEMGILVWQDFMFGCSLYPGDQAFLNNVRQEAIDNVKRLRNHPSVVAWVGNNEIESGWFHWGWKEKLPAQLWEDYLKLFYGVLPDVCAELDPSRPYWPSSPSSKLEDDNESQKMGDLHYWQVWHAAAPFSEYEKQTPRFMSEYGFQSFPQIETVNTYTIPADHDIASPVMMAHQRHPRGNQLIREYMLREYPEPKDFESFLYVSQVLQAEGIKIGAEHLRRIRPHNMGSLYWQINDCWPVASWSSMDYTGRWKALQYYAHRFYSEVLVSFRKKDGDLELFIVSDRVRPAQGELKLTLLNFSGEALWNRQIHTDVPALESKLLSTVAIDEVLKGRERKSVFLLAELVVDGKTVSNNKYFFEPFKNLALAPAKVSAEVAPTRKGLTLIVSSDKLARAVYLSSPGYTFSDNYFDVIPGRPVEVEVQFTGSMSRLKEFLNSVKIRSLSDAF